MTGSKTNIERCLVCGAFLTGEGQCPSCDVSKVRVSATTPNLTLPKGAGQKSAGKKDAAEVEVDFQFADDAKDKYVANSAFLFNKATKERFELSQAVSKVGRDRSNNIPIPADHHISRYHAWILQNKGKFWIEDLGSTNGTLLNGTPITVRTRLRSGDKLTFGKTQLIFVVD